jgi:putative membrane protein
MRWLVLALGVMLATRIVPGITCQDGATLLVVVLLLSFFNAILKPLMVLFTLPFILVTLGLGVVVINALLFLLVGRLVNGFHVDGFWSAVFGSLVVSVTNLLLSSFTRGGRPPRNPPTESSGPPARGGGDVIDI